MKNTLKVSASGDREITFSRLLDAPRRLVWDAMTKPEFIKRWLFSPPGWSMTHCEENLHAGGKYRWEWAGPDGKTAMVMHGIYREIVPGQRVVRTEIFDLGCGPMGGGENIATLILTEQGQKTLMTGTVLYPSKEARDGMLASGMEQGMSAGYDQMEELLMSMSAKQ